MCSSLLTRLRGSRGGEGAVRHQVLQVFHDLVGAVCVVPAVLLFIPSLGRERWRRTAEFYIEQWEEKKKKRERSGLNKKLCQRYILQSSSKELKTVFGLELSFCLMLEENC